MNTPKLWMMGFVSLTLTVSGLAHNGRLSSGALIWILNTTKVARPAKAAGFTAKPAAAPAVDLTGFIYAKGLGSISYKEPDPAKAYIKARDVAYASALSNLVTRLNGISIQHSVQIEDYEARRMNARLEASGNLQGMETLSERQVLINGSPAVEVIVGVPKLDRQPEPVPVIKPAQNPRPRPLPPVVDVAPPVEKGYTSVIIDARGTRVDRSMSPRLLFENGSVIWGDIYADHEFVIGEGIAVYARSIEEARLHPRAGNRPLVIRASRAVGNFKSDLILPAADASLLISADKASGFLSKFRVIIVKD